MTRNKKFRNRFWKKSIIIIIIFIIKIHINNVIIITLQTQLVQTLRCNAIVALMTHSYSQFTAEQCVQA